MKTAPHVDPLAVDGAEPIARFTTYPCRVEAVDELGNDLFRWGLARLYVTEHRLWIFIERDGTPTLDQSYLLDQTKTPTEQIEGDIPNRRYTAHLDGGMRLIVNPGSGCGCSSSLWKWGGPWAPMRYGTP